jgi:cell fate (sporulation/competence/biofilm development) regulator YmcA (YheA/YmcA/DUF963 family)
MSKKYPLELTIKEAVRLFLFLRDKNMQKDPVAFKLQKKLEAILYEELTIDELENLEEFYNRIPL